MALDKRTEMLWILGVMLGILGVLGIDHSPVFGVFSTTLIQNMFYILIGLGSVVFLTTHRKSSKYIALLFGVLGLLGIVFPIGSFADSYLHLFFSISYLWIYYARDEKRRIHLTPA